MTRAASETRDGTATGAARDAARGRRALRIGAALSAALLLAWLLHTTAFATYRVVSESMTPALLPGDRVLVDKLVFGARLPLLGVRLPALRAPRPGDVLLFRHPDDPRQVLVKRCAAVGGTVAPFPRGGLTVPDDMLFVLGDNRDHSSDSREWGFLPREDVIGRAARVVWSSGPDGIRRERFLAPVE